MPYHSNKGLKIAKRKKRNTDGPIQPHLVLPKDTFEAEQDPLMQQYVKIGETALKKSSDLGEKDAA